MAWNKDLTGVDSIKKGTFRSLNGAADENIFTGRASKAGFYCFFKVWRDMPYDAILDYKGTLYRVEVKGGSDKKFNVTRGTRSGKQIMPGTSRTKLLSRDDCDFVVGVDSNSGDCYIVPEDVVLAIGRNNLSAKTLASFKEKWQLFMYDVYNFKKEWTKDGLLNMNADQLTELAQTIGITIPSADYSVPGTHAKIQGDKEKTVYLIWEHIASTL